MVVIALSAIGGGLAFLAPDPSPFTDLPPFMAWFAGGAILLGLALTPFIVAAVISFQSINPFSSKVRARPSHGSNPFRFGNPLLFFHFASFVIILHGVGMGLTSLVGGVARLLQGLCAIVGGFACLAGVQLAMRWCRHKMAEEQAEAPNHAMRTAGDSPAAHSRR